MKIIFKTKCFNIQELAQNIALLRFHVFEILLASEGKLKMVFLADDCMYFNPIPDVSHRGAQY